LTGIRGEDGHALVAELGDRARYLDLEVSEESHWSRVMGEVLGRHGRLDVLVNNAGWLKPGLTLENTSLVDWRRHFAVHADGTFLGCKHAILSMKDTGGGSIINVASAVALRVHSQSPAYVVSKAAVLAWTRTAALHCGERKYRIRINAVLPGPIDTGMMRSNVSNAAEFDALAAMLTKKYPMDRLGTAEDVANVVLFLALQRSGFVNGAAYTVAGGQSDEARHTWDAETATFDAEVPTMTNKILRPTLTPVRRLGRREFVTRRECVGLGALAGIGTLFGFSSATVAAAGCEVPMASDLSSLKAVRVFSGEDGHSHFEEIDLKAEVLPFRLQGDPKITPGFFKYFESKATRVTILRGPANLDLPWHNAPSSAHEFFFMLQGSNTLITRTASRVILPGMITIFEDATGTGHAGKVGPDGYTVLNVQLA
jgi:3(or 17)beta-hydroxysteroid dehydrogenase